jgi:hypothetical protein
MSTRIWALMLFVCTKLGAQSCCCGNVGSITGDGFNLINQPGMFVTATEDFRHFNEMKMSSMHHHMTMNADVLKQSSLSSLSFKDVFKKQYWLQVNVAYLKAMGMNSTKNGFTDLSLLGGRYFLFSERNYLSMAVGAKLPTASVADESAYNTLAVFGTGSIDPILQAMYVTIHRNMRYRADAFVRYATRNKESKTFGSFYSASASAAYSFIDAKECTDNVKQKSLSEFVLAAGITYELFSKMKMVNADVNNTGGNVVFVKVEANMQWRKNYLSLAFMQPVSQAWYGMQPSMKERVKLSITRKIK